VLGLTCKWQSGSLPKSSRRNVRRPPSRLECSRPRAVWRHLPASCRDCRRVEPLAGL